MGGGSGRLAGTIIPDDTMRVGDCQILRRGGTVIGRDESQGLEYLTAFAFEEDHHHIGKDEVELLMMGEGLFEFFDLESPLEEGGFFGHPHGNVTARFGGGVAGVKEVAGGHADDGNTTEEAVEEFGGGVLFANGVIDVVVAGVEDFVMGSPNAAPSATADRAKVVPGGIGEVVTGGPIEDLLCFNLGEKGGLGFVVEDFDVLFEFEGLLLGVADNASAGVGHCGLAGESQNFKGEGEGPMQALHLAGNIISRGNGGCSGSGVGVGIRH